MATDSSEGRGAHTQVPYPRWPYLAVRCMAPRILSICRASQRRRTRDLCLLFRSASSYASFHPRPLAFIEIF